MPSLLVVTFSLIVICIFMAFVLSYILNIKAKSNQLQKFSVILFLLLIFWFVGLILQINLSEKYSINPIYFEYFIYIQICFLPIFFLYLALSFFNNKFRISPSMLCLAIVPIISLIMLWTNDYHHLFYKVYSININETVFGSYFKIHYIYTYSLYIIGIFIFLKYSIKNSGLFSKQAILIIVGSIFPIVINLLGFLRILPMTIYLTPISISFSVILYSIAIFKFNFINIVPIALKKVVDRMSDSYIVTNEENIITDYNQTFINTFSTSGIRLLNRNLFIIIKEFLNDEKFADQVLKDISKAKEKNITIKIEKYFEIIDQYFEIEITSIMANNNFIGTLILLKNITQHVIDMKTIESNQEILIEKERLATLGQMIGGIAHNLKTPIMSISGATEGISCLIQEYDDSIDDNQVTSNDHHEIAHEMENWVYKIKSYLSYMSDIITAVKGQAVTFSNNTQNIFIIEDLLKYVEILINNDIKNANLDINMDIKVDNNIKIKGDINSLVQVINNIILNAIEAYNGKTNECINFSMYKQYNLIIIKIEDNAGGIPIEVQEKLFKEMVTTKGKLGTGLGLFMSYSNIKAYFSGNIRYETQLGIGTTFYIEIPI